METLQVAPPEYQHDTIRRITWRLIPFMMLLYFIAFLNRVNVGFAAKIGSMNTDLGISETLYGFCGGIFFVGYFLLEVPSNLLLHRFGARRWIARIMITWGIISAGTAFVIGAKTYVSARFLLGMAEAGFFPGMILYLTYWFPAAIRARMTALFVAAIPISGIIGAPLSGYLLDMNGIGGLKGWQWMFLIEGIPAIILGAIVPFYLTDRPAQARWLKPAQIEWIESTLEGESRQKAHMPLLRALVHPSILALSAIYFCMMIGLYNMNLWMPSVLEGAGIAKRDVKWIAAIPPICGALLMFFWGRHSDRTREREGHVAFALLTAAAGCVLAALPTYRVFGDHFTPLTNQIFCTSGFCLLAIGIYCAMPTFWPLPSARLSGTAAAGGIAVVNSVGNLGGFAGPYAIGYIKDHWFGYTGGLLATAVVVALGAVLVMASKPKAVLQPPVP